MKLVYFWVGSNSTPCLRAVSQVFDFTAREPLSVSGDTFDCHRWEVGALLVSSEWKSGMQLNATL